MKGIVWRRADFVGSFGTSPTSHIARFGPHNPSRGLIRFRAHLHLSHLGHKEAADLSRVIRVN